MSGRAAGTAFAAAVLGAAVLALLGLWESDRWADDEVEGMARTLAAVGPIDSASLQGYRVLPDFDCLVYRRGGNPYALELCVDGEGRMVETVDRRSFERRVHSLRQDPDSSTLRVDRAVVERLLEKMGARNMKR